ncbi:MAG TPA: alpha/beta fold hydrolase [Nocardioides sp.]|nr:alpha/beta fold hydrolase [Nocardioides sp.]
METNHALAGARGELVVHAWTADAGRFVVLLAHGIGEHAGRYDHVARHLVAHGAAAVHAPDHAGHGLSEGPRAEVEVESMVADLHRVAERLRRDHPGLPLVLVGHSLGGIISTRYAQEHPGELAALVLSGPVIGGNPGFEALLAMDPMPEVPIDPAALSRDPAVGEAYLADPLIHHGALSRETLQDIFAAVATIAAGPGLGGLPTLWLHGELDPLAPYDVTAAAFEVVGGTALEHRSYPGAMHEIFNETNRAEVLEDMTSFLDVNV